MLTFVPHAKLFILFVDSFSQICEVFTWLETVIELRDGLGQGIVKFVKALFFLDFVHIS